MWTTETYSLTFRSQHLSQKRYAQMVHDQIGILYFSGQSGIQLCFPVRKQISLHAQRMQFTKCCYRRYGISLHEQLTH